MIENASGIDLGGLGDRMRQAVAELQGTIAAHYPTATFSLARSPEHHGTLHLLVTADVADPDEVGDLVVERVVALQAEEGIPLHVIPLRTPERMAAMRAAKPRRGERPGRGGRLREAMA